MKRRYAPGAPAAAAGAAIVLLAGASALFAADLGAAEPAGSFGPGAARPLSAVQVMGVDGYALTVSDLNRSFIFYRNVLGLPVLQAPGRSNTNRIMEALTNSPGTLFRSSRFGISGNFELTLAEFTHIERRAQRPRLVDPGAAMLVVTVHDLPRVLAAARQSGAHIVTHSDRPLRLPDGASSVLLSDPDGFYLRIEQLAGNAAAANPAADAAEANVIAVRLVYTVAEPATVQRFYHNVLSLAVLPGSFITNSTFDDLLGTPGAQLDVIHAGPSNPRAMLEFIAFRGVVRHLYLGRPRDPGAANVALRVRDLSSALRRIRSSGAVIVSAGGQAVNTGNGSLSVLVRDPAGMLLQLTQRP